MEFKEELQQLVDKMLMIEYRKKEEERDKPYNDIYHGKKKYALYYEYYIYEKEKEEYELGLRHKEIVFQNYEKMNIEDFWRLPNVAETSAVHLLTSNGILYPQCITLDEILPKSLILLEKGQIDKFTWERIKLAHEYLTKASTLTLEYFSEKGIGHKRG